MSSPATAQHQPSITPMSDGGKSAGILSEPAKMVIETDKKQAEAVGIVMALFAGALVSLAQIVESTAQQVDTRPASWQALRVFLYSATILNLTGAFLSLVIIKMCSDLPLAYYQRSCRGVTPPTPLPKGVEPWSRRAILIEAGMYRRYTFVDGASTLMLLAAIVFTFASFTFWVLLNSQNGITSGVTVTFFGIAALVAFCAFLVAAKGEQWG